MKSFLLIVTAVIAFSFPALAQDKAGKEAAGQEEVKLISVDEAVKIIASVKGDKAKLKAYCDSQALYAQADEAAEKNDTKKADELAEKADEMGAKVGEAFDDVMVLAAELDPEKAEGKKFFDALDGLDAACGK